MAVLPFLFVASGAAGTGIDCPIMVSEEKIRRWLAHYESPKVALRLEGVVGVVCSRPMNVLEEALDVLVEENRRAAARHEQLVERLHHAVGRGTRVCAIRDPVFDFDALPGLRLGHHFVPVVAQESPNFAHRKRRARAGLEVERVVCRLLSVGSPRSAFVYAENDVV